VQLARVVGTVVATRKHHRFEGAKLLMVQPVTPGGEPQGRSLLAVDAVGAGVGELVLLVIEGRAAAAALDSPQAPVDAAIIGIVDAVDLHDEGGAS
jgi:ethanolamine utilization protein EutN